MFGECCSSESHPNDWVCYWFGIRKPCSQGEGVHTPSGTTGPGGTEKPLPNLLAEIDRANIAADEPLPRETLLRLQVALQPFVIAAKSIERTLVNSTTIGISMPTRVLEDQLEDTGRVSVEDVDRSITEGLSGSTS